MEEREKSVRKRRTASLSEQLTVGRNEASYWQSNQMEQRLSGPRRWLAAWGCAQGQTVTYTLIAGNCPFCQRLLLQPWGERKEDRFEEEPGGLLASSPPPHVVIAVCVRESPTGEDSSAKCACCRFGVMKRGASVIIPPRAVGAHPRAPPCTCTAVVLGGGSGRWPRRRGKLRE